VSSTTCYPAANDLAEAFNKIIGYLLKKFVLKSQRDWDDKLGKCLWADYTIGRTPTNVMSFFLVYICEAVLSLKIQIPFLRVTLTTRMVDKEKYRLRLQDLEALDDKGLHAQ